MTAAATPARTREAWAGYLCISPWLLGFAIFTAGPIIASIIIAFTHWDLITAPTWAGWSNFTRLLGWNAATGQFMDPLFWKSVQVTMYYAVLSVPLTLIASILVAVLMNQKVKGITLFRTLYYLPAVMPAVAGAMLWRWLLNRDSGLLNQLLEWLHLPTQGWLTNPSLVIPAFVIMGLWGVGGGMLIYLAGLQGIPTQLYEAADLDGAGSWQKFWKVTLPMLSPVILYNLVMSIIGSFQAGFTSAYIMTGGGPDNASLFYSLYLYKNAFQYSQMGLACAQAWILFLMVLAVTLLVFKQAAGWVHYEGGERGK